MSITKSIAIIAIVVPIALLYSVGFFATFQTKDTWIFVNLFGISDQPRETNIENMTLLEWQHTIMPTREFIVGGGHIGIGSHWVDWPIGFNVNSFTFNDSFLKKFQLGKHSKLLHISMSKTSDTHRVGLTMC